MTRQITIHYNNGDAQTVVVDRVSGARTEEREGHKIVHFGRVEDGGWHELVTAPMESVRSWGYT